ncbi:MAG: endonuclease/exonuclease/phosphatase family protein [Patescibacteria group bacterium]|jgi:endonuclease/exonuclease/phosphatase family metal-dependent hydrolase
MKIISLNVGIKIDNSKKVGDFIKSQDPDFVALQEVIRHLDDSVYKMYRSKSDIERVISKKMPYYFFGPQWITNAMIMGGKMHRDFNGYVEQGNEIISKYPIVTATNEHYYKKYSLELEWNKFYTEDHPRSMIVVEYKLKNRKLQIINLHGLYSRNKKDSEKTINQTKFILEVVKRKKIPTIIVGDFNLFPETKSIKMLDKKFRNLIKENKIKSTRPKFNDGTDKGENVVDYIFINDQIKVNKFEVFNTTISDHLPLILDFDIK